MTPAAEQSLIELRSKLRKASLATIGGFRPPEDPATSWFGAGMCMPGEALPTWNGQPMFPLLQIRVSELPYAPEALQGTALLVLFHNAEVHPFDKPNGEGWLIREYASLEGLIPLPPSTAPTAPRPFPILWNEISDDAPGWEDAWDVVDLDPVNDDEAATNSFFDDFNRYHGTKVGGYPREVQHGVGLENFVFQVGSEEKPRWMWADNGIGYFFKDASGTWTWSCQFY